MATKAKKAPRGRAAGRAPRGAFQRAGKGVKSMYAQFNWLAKGTGAKGGRGGKAASGGGAG